MGFKSFLLLIILAFLAIFSIQNLQSISLVFFGFNSLALPLSIWIIFSLLAGIISSLLVQFLSTNTRQKNKYNQSFSPPPPNYPPSPSVSEKVTPQTNSQRFTSPQVKDEGYLDDDFDIFEEQPMPPVGDRQIEYDRKQPVVESTSNHQQPITNFSTEKQDVSTTSEREFVEVNKQDHNQTKNREVENIPKEKFSPSTEKEPVDEIPSEAWLKAREASLYSYQPKEKTEIKTPSRKVENINNRSHDSTYRRSSDGIYDAPYRVIPPSRERSNKEDEVYWDDEDDDWDF